MRLRPGGSARAAPARYLGRFPDLPPDRGRTGVAAHQGTLANCYWRLDQTLFARPSIWIFLMISRHSPGEYSHRFPGQCPGNARKLRGKLPERSRTNPRNCVSIIPGVPRRVPGNPWGTPWAVFQNVSSSPNTKGNICQFCWELRGRSCKVLGESL